MTLLHKSFMILLQFRSAIRRCQCIV